MTNKELLEQRPKATDYDLSPYGYISALSVYINKLEEALSEDERHTRRYRQ